MASLPTWPFNEGATVHRIDWKYFYSDTEVTSQKKSVFSIAAVGI
jgi:hypothetical protein